MTVLFKSNNRLRVIAFYCSSKTQAFKRFINMSTNIAKYKLNRGSRSQNIKVLCIAEAFLDTMLRVKDPKASRRNPARI